MSAAQPRRPTGPAPDTQPNPFPGLRPFREDEEYLFFGRENQVDAMVDKLAQTRFLAVVGTSGSGKSSLVNCGLRPALRLGLMASAGTAWRMAQCRPGSDPIGAMARALAQEGVLFSGRTDAGLPLAEIVDTTLRMSKLGLVDIVEQGQLDAGVKLLLVVDQFEELFRYRRRDAGARGGQQGLTDEATEFVNLLLEVKAHPRCPIFIVLTMRSDYLDDCTQFPGLAEAINAGQYLVPRMTRDERRAAIVGPVAVGGAQIAPVLVTRLVNDVGDNPDQLSILQHALNRTWAHWHTEGGRQGPLDLAHYEAIGSMAHALDQHAERAYAELTTPRQQQICEKLLKALTDKATDPRGIRRPTTLGDLCALADATAAEVIAVSEVFRRPSRSFLMPPAGEPLDATTFVDISHESLMRVWQRLNTWADEEARSAQTYRRLAETAVLHAAGKASLWRDPDLQLALDWRDQTQPNATWAARYHPGFAAAMQFLTESSDARTGERAEREAMRRQAGKSRRMRWVAGVGVVFAAVAVLFLWFALDSKQEARRLAALAFWNAGVGVRDRDGVKAAHSFLNAARVTAESGQQDSLVLAAQFATAGLVRAFPAGFSLVKVNRGGSRILTWGADQVLRLWDPSRTLPLQTWSQDKVNDAQITDDGAHLLTWNDKVVTLWDAGQARPLAQWPQDQPVVGAAITGDGTQVLTWTANGLRLWHASRDTAVATWPMPMVAGAGFSPNGTRVVAWGSDGTVILRDARTGSAIGQWAHGGQVSRALFAPDGARVLSWGDDRSLKLWDADQPDRPALVMPHKGAIIGARVAPDGARILSWDAAGAVRLWDTTQPQAPPRVWLHDKAVLGAVFSPDASRILSWGRDDMLKLWDAAESGLLVQSRAVARITGAVFAQGGSRLLSWGSDGGLSLWDDTQTAPLQAWRHDQSVTGAVLTDGDAHVLSWDRDFALTLWNLGKNAPLRDSGNILSAVFLPDGAQVIYLDRVDGALKSWDLTRAAADTLSTGHPVARAVFAPDGSRCITWAADGSASLLQPTQPALPPRGWPRGQQAKGAVFTPDGSHFLSWDDNSVTLWAADHVDAPLKSWPVAGVKGAAFAANGTRFLSWDGATVRVWDSGQSAESGKPRRIEAVDGAVFTHDGTRFLAWSGAGSVSLWDLDKSGGPADVWAIDGVKGLLFDKTDARFVSWAGDGSLALWDLGQGEPLMQWRSGSDNLLLSAVASPDLTRILSWGNAGAALWHAGLDDPKLGLAARILKLEICSATRMDKKGQLARLKMAEWLDEKYQDAQRQQSCN